MTKSPLAPLALAAVLLVPAALVSCGSELSADEQHAAGAQVWEVYCRECHSEGGIGTRISPSALASYRSAGALLDYTRLAMPYGMNGVLTDDEYAAVVAFLLHEHGLLPLETALDPAAAANIPLEE